MQCRYLAAPGTETEAPSPFGSHLRLHGIQLPRDCSMAYMVHVGWISPLFRVPLPRSALESWKNYPEFPNRGTERCPAEDSWGLDLWVNAMTSPMPGTCDTPNWWLHFLDDVGNPLNKLVRAHATDRNDEGLLPACFAHPHGGREVKPWIDFFAYWQAYQVAELLASATRRFYVTPGFEKRVATGADVALECVAKFACRIRRKWEGRRPTFEWLSRFRTIIAAGMERETGDVEAAARDSARQQGLTPEQVAAEIRDTLLVAWQDLDRIGNALPGGDTLRASLRQDIEYALYLLRILSGQPIDFLTPGWTYPDRLGPRPWAQLIDALPRDVWLARQKFSDLAIEYVDRSMWPAPGKFSIDAKAIDDLLATRWNRSRALRRFCLAFFRMHQELSGRVSGGGVLHSNEVIEQMIVTILNAEKLIMSIHGKAESSENGRQPGTWDVVKAGLKHLLEKLNLSESGAREKVDALKSRTRLHNLAARGRDIFITPADVGSGSDDADYFAAAHVNFVIARNYAAHHDSLDEEFVVPNDLDPSQHLGRVAIQSTLTVALASLQTAADSQKPSGSG
jgi:hypothetical protein